MAIIIPEESLDPTQKYRNLDKSYNDYAEEYIALTNDSSVQEFIDAHEDFLNIDHLLIAIDKLV